MKRFRKWLRVEPRYASIPEELHLEDEENAELTLDLNQNERKFRAIFKNCSDINFRKISLAGQERQLIIYLASLVNEEVIDDHILSPMLIKSK